MFLIFVVYAIGMLSVKGIRVAEFSMDGKYSIEPFLNYTQGIGSNNLDDFTICLRFYVNYLKPLDTYPLSYTTFLEDNSLTMRISITTTDSAKTEESKKLTLVICKYVELQQGCGIYQQNHLKIHQEWHHVCFTLSTARLNSSTILSETKLYYDEKLYMDSDKFRPLYAKGSFILGQEQDGLEFGGMFDKNQAFSGKLSQVELWDTELTSTDIEFIANCSVLSLRPLRRVISWDSSAWFASQIDMLKDEPLPNICSKNSLNNQFLWLEPTHHNDFSDKCDLVGGILPIVNDANQLKQDHENKKDIIKSVLNNSSISGNDASQCFLTKSSIVFWMGLQRNSKLENWFSPYNLTQDFSNFTLDVPTDNDYYKCVYNFGGKAEPANCNKPRDGGNKIQPCGICELPPERLFYLKGLCEKDINENYDVQYYVYGVRDQKPFFRGVSKSNIFFNATLSKWILQSLINPDLYLESQHNKLPIGTTHWKKTGALSKSDDHGSVIPLTFSFCYPDKFTCNSGHCKPLTDRCNIKLNCKDKSDEINCDAKLKIENDYNKEVVPISRVSESEDNVDHDPIYLYINISIIAVPEINTKELKFTVDFEINLRWFDSRLHFWNLQNRSIINRIKQKDKEVIWKPELVFVNALGPPVDNVGSSTVVLVKQGNPLKENISLNKEAYLYPGNENSIIAKRRYFQEFSCILDLHYYPFDTQVCQMEFEMVGETEDWLIFEKDGSGVELYQKSLVEYEIEKAVLNITSVHDKSRAYVRIVFRRKFENHITNTFLQTLLLVFIGFLSLFFNLEEFTDRIMVVLTTMLVTFIITSSIQQELPLTSYKKLIDWWLLFTSNIMILLLIFHTYLAYDVSEAKKESTNQSVKPFNNNEDFDDEEFERRMEFAKLKNIICGIIFLGFLITFNIIFWSLALVEHSKSAEEYLSSS